MKSMIALLVLITSLTGFALETGKPAPDFKLPGIGQKDGEYSLSQFKGKIVVLEWVNHGCPFVRKHYDSGNMQSLQKKYTSQDVVWLSVNSSAPGKQGHTDVAAAKDEVKKYNSAATAVLLDPAGTVGRMYEAKTTPHMYIINKEGQLAYQGAIDDKPDTDKDSVKGAKGYVSEALDLLIANKPVTAHTTKAYGCGVKYQ